MLGWKSHSCPVKKDRGRSDLYGKQTWGPEHNGMAAVPKIRPRVKSFCGIEVGKPTCQSPGKADVAMGRNG